MSTEESVISTFVNCLFSPRLYRIYNIPTKQGPYLPNAWEKWGNAIINVSILLWHFSFYASPFLTYSAYNRGYFSNNGFMFISKIGTTFISIIGISYLIRTYGRITNPEYLEFYGRYKYLISNYNANTKRELQNYEFDYSARPVDFQWNDSGNKLTNSCGGYSLCNIIKNPASIIGYAIIHTFGIKMIYPGSISSLNFLLKDNLDAGRKKIIERDNGIRNKLITPDGNTLDTMFIDQRGKGVNGSTLVICTEGNAGFYEIGIMVTPMELGYSVLGWNHPGFACSTGIPYPCNEKCAADTIIQFAFQKLNFMPENIILFGWSIGGFASSYLTTQYPDLQAVILDATFDHITPLAAKQMPNILEPIVRITMEDHANLDVAGQLIQFKGPIQLIRRSEDEIISLVDGDISSNRGNHLLERILTFRYPSLVTNESTAALWDWLGATGHKKDIILNKYGVDIEQCKNEHSLYDNNHRREFPAEFGNGFSSSKKTQMILYLASIYMSDFSSTHCTSLPPSMFNSYKRQISN